MSHRRHGSAKAAVSGRGVSPECHRRPQLKHAYWRIQTPVCMSMTLSARGRPSHFQHRVLFPLRSAPRLPLSGIVVLLGQALKVLIQEDERVSGQRFTHGLLRSVVLNEDHSSAWYGLRIWNFIPFAKKHFSSVRQTAHDRLPATPPVRINSTLGSSQRSTDSDWHRKP